MTTLIKGSCPVCGPNRNADVIQAHKEIHVEAVEGTFSDFDFRILKCRGCGEVYFQKISAFSDDMIPSNHDVAKDRVYRAEFWPNVTRHRPGWMPNIALIDDKLYELLEETYRALNSGLKVITAIGLRTAIDRTTEVLKIDPGRTFEEKLNDLEKAGKISNEERKAVGVLIDAGSAAAHRGWRPSDGDLNTMLSITENFLHRTFILDSESKELGIGIPPKPSRGRKSPP
jgi:hypothetical protein